jgi:alpha-mannosidase
MTTNAEEARRALAGHTIWLWHYLHADWQWEQSRAWHEERYALAVAEALDIMQRDPEFRYFFDTASEFFEPVARKLASRLEELRQRVREGRIRIVSAQVANCRPNQVGDETYLRNLQLGREFFQANLPPTDLSQFHSVDVAIGHSQMPQILRLAGFAYYRAWRPHGPLNALGIPQQFTWQGLDGSQILVTRGSYGGLWTDDQLPANYAADWDATVARLYEQQFRDQLLYERSPSGHLWMIQGLDDARPLRTYHDTWVDLPGFLAEWRRRESVPIHWCTPLEFNQAVAAQAERLAVVQGVLDGCDCGYQAAFGGANGLWRWRQMNDRRLLRAEWWTAAATAVGYPAPHAELKCLWREHLTYQAHAMDCAFRDDFAYLLGLARHVQFHAEHIEQEALHRIVRAAGGGDRTVQYVFNPHPWPVEADVEMYHPCPAAGVESLEMVDDAGQTLPQQRLAEFRHPRFAGSLNDQHRLVRLALPPMGYRRVRVVERADPAPKPPMPPEDGLPDVCGLRLIYREHALREIHDQFSGALYAARDGAPWPNLAFHVLDHQSWPTAGPELRREHYIPQTSQWLQTGPLRWQHRSQGMLGPFQAQIDTLVGEREREVQFQVRLEGHWQEAPQSGFVTFCGDIPAGGQITVDVPFGVEPRDPDHEIYVHNLPQKDLGINDMIERLRPGFLWGRSWADWSGDGQGITWISTDGNYYWFKEPGLFGHILLRCLARPAGGWEEFAGDHWSGAGVHVFNYALRFHDGDCYAADPQRRSAELRHPPVVVRADCLSPATMPQVHSFLQIQGPALLSAYYREDEATYARLYEREGRGGEVTCTFDWTPSSAQAVDLLGQALDIPVRAAGQRVYVSLRPWQIVTLKLS